MFEPKDPVILAAFKSEKEYRSELAKNSAWLSSVDRTLPDIVASALGNRIRTPAEYEPLSIDVQLSGSASALDRAIAKRNDIFRLDDSAIERALNLDGARALLPIQKELDLLSATNDVEKEAVRRKYDILNRKLDEREQRYSAPNSASNFIERRSRLVTLFEDDIIECYERAKALRQGIFAAYGYKLDALPNPSTSPTFLEEIVMWIRLAGRLLERIRTGETLLAIEVPFRQLTLGKDHVATAIFDEDMWTRLLNSELVYFSTARFFDAIFDGQFETARSRVLGVAARYSLSDENYGHADHRSYHLKLELFPPDVKRSDEPDAPNRNANDAFVPSPPPVVLGDVTFHESNSQIMDMVSPAHQHFPARGRWGVRIDKTVTYRLLQARNLADRDAVRIDDIRLLFDVAVSK